MAEKISNSSSKHLDWISVLAAVVLCAGFLNGLLVSRYHQFQSFGNLPVPQSSLESRPSTPNGPSADVRDQLGHTGFFWSEAAFHYRLTLMYAVDDYVGPEILGNDKYQQYPSGVQSWRQYGILMEPVYGTLFRWLGSGRTTLVDFLIQLLPWVHAVLLVPLFVVCRKLGANFPASLAAVLVYATSSLVFSPILEALYLKETFSWLLLAFFQLGHFAVLREFRWSYLLLACASLFLFLISWHLAPFLVFAIVLATLLAQARDPWSVPKGIYTPAGYLIVGLCAGLVPWLQERWFYLSPTFLLLVGWTAWTWVVHRNPRWITRAGVRWLALIAMVTLALLLPLLNRTFSADYSHVTGLIWHRLVHFFQKPMDPMEIPFAVRVFWVSPFTSPRWSTLVYGIGFNAIVLMVGIIWASISAFKRDVGLAHRALAFSTVGFLLAFLLVERLAPVFIMFGVIALAVGVSGMIRAYPRVVPSLAAGLFLFLFPVLNLALPLGDLVRISKSTLSGHIPGLGSIDQTWGRSRAELFEWMQAHPGPMGLQDSRLDVGIVAEIGMSPQILLYTGQPTVLNSQFENVEIRDRYEEYLEALFASNEADLIGFCEKYQAGYLLINRDWAVSRGRNAPHYLAGHSGNLSLAANMGKLHFQPDLLEAFSPIYENQHYRLFRFDSSRDRAFDACEPTLAKWWNLENYRVSGGHIVEPSVSRRALEEMDRKFSELPNKLGRLAFEMETIRQRTTGVAQPRMDLMTLQRQVADLRFRIATGDTQAVLPATLRELEMTAIGRLAEKHPDSGKTLQHEILALLNGQSETQEPGLLASMASLTLSPEEYGNVGQILVLLGEFELAGEMFGKGGSLFEKPARTEDPEGRRPSELQEHLWRETILNLIAGGNRAKARGVARFCAQHVAPGSANLSFFLQAANMDLNNGG